jgi:hypothetical protein
LPLRFVGPASCVVDLMRAANRRSRFRLISLVMLYLFLGISVLPETLNIEAKRVEFSSETATVQHRWSFKDNLIDTGSATTKNHLTGVNIAYTANSPHTNLGKALDLNGTAYAYSEILLDDIYTDYSKTGISFSVWVEPVMGDSRAVFDKYLTREEPGPQTSWIGDRVTLSVFASSVTFAVSVEGKKGYVRSKQLSAETWSLVVAMMAGNGTIYLYVNNILTDIDDKLCKLPRNNDGTGSNFTVGCETSRAGMTRFNYKPIDELQILEGLLTQDEIRGMFWEGIQPPLSGDWILTNDMEIRDRKTTVNGSLLFPQHGSNGERIFRNMTITLNGDITPTGPYKVNITFVDTTLFFNGAYTFTTGDAALYVNFTNVKFLNLSGYARQVVLKFVHVYVKNVEIRGFAKNSSTGCSDAFRLIALRGQPHFENVYIHDINGTGIQTVELNHATFRNITVLNPRIIGFHLIHVNNSVFRDIFIDDTIKWSLPSANFMVIHNSVNNTFQNLQLSGYWNTTDNPHKAVFFSDSSTNNTIRDSLLKNSGNGIYMSTSAGTVNYAENVTITNDRRFNNADGIDTEEEGVLVVKNCSISNCVHIFSIEQGGTFYVYNTKVDGWTFAQQTIYRGDIYSCEGVIYLINSPIRSVAHGTPLGQVHIYQQWSFLETDMNVTVHTMRRRASTSPQQNVNVTLLAAMYSDGKLSVTLEAPPNTTSTTYVYVGEQGAPVRIEGADDFEYNRTSEVFAFAVKHNSIQTVTVYWKGSVSMYMDVQLSPNETKVGDKISVTAYIKDVSGNPIEGATITTVIGNNAIILVDVGDGFYEGIIDTTDFRVGTNDIVFVAEKESYITI